MPFGVGKCAILYTLTIMLLPLTTEILCVGRTSCVGRNVALATLRLVTACFLSKYHIRFAPGEGISEAVERDLKDGVVSQPGKLVLTFKSRTSVLE